MIAGNEQRFAEASIEGCTNHPIAFAIINSTQLGAAQNASLDSVNLANIVNNLPTSGRGR